MDRHIPIKNIYLMLCYAWDRLKEKEIVEVENIDGYSIFDLLSRVLINGINYLIKRGLDREYIGIKEDTSLMKGKIDFNSSMKRMLLIKGKLDCESDDLSYNVLQNQIIKSIMDRLIQTKELNKDLKINLTKLYKNLSEVDTIKLRKKLFGEVEINRNNNYYKFILNICELIYDNLLIDEKTGFSKFKDFERDEKQMAYLFEHFVRNFYKRELNGYSVSRETIHWDAYSESTNSIKDLPNMQTDITLLSANRKIIIDTKYHRDAFSHNWGGKKFKSNNLYQIFAYLKNSEVKGGVHKNSDGILLYPKVDEEMDFEYIVQGHKIKVKTIDLNADWKIICEKLIKITSV